MKELNNFENFGNTPFIKELTKVMNILKEKLEYNLSGNVHSDIEDDAAYVILTTKSKVELMEDFDNLDDSTDADVWESLLRSHDAVLAIEEVDEYGDFDFGNVLPNTYYVVVVDKNWNALGSEEVEVDDSDKTVTIEED